MKILVLKRDKLGDMLLTTPMLQLLRKHYPHAIIDILTPEYTAWIADSFPFVNKVWSYQRVRIGKKISITAIIRQVIVFYRIRKMRFDWGIAAGGEFSHRAVKRLLWAGAKNNISYIKKDKNIMKISHPLYETTKGHESVRIAKLLTPLNIDVPTTTELLPNQFFNPSQNIIKSTNNYISDNKLHKSKYIVIGLGARRKKKQLSHRQVDEISTYFHNSYNLQTILMWTPGKSDDPNYPGDDELANEILVNNPKHITPFCGPIKQAVGIIWNAKISVFPDSGLMHFAACSPGGVLGLFAEVDISPHPDQWGPLGRNSKYMVANESVSTVSNHEIINSIVNTMNINLRD